MGIKPESPHTSMKRTRARPCSLRRFRKPSAGLRASGLASTLAGGKATDQSDCLAVIGCHLKLERTSMDEGEPGWTSVDDRKRF